MTHARATVALIFLLPLLLLAAPACRDAGGTLVLEFPSEETFLASGEARISVYDAEEDVDLCRQLVAGEPAGDDPVASLGLVDVCEHADGLQRLSGLEQGVRALFVEVVGKSDVPILRGCRTINVDLDGGDVRVPLAVTADFETERRDSSCRTAMERCSGGCE